MTEPEARGFQGGFRQSMSWLHTWAGLVLSVVLYFMFVTGSAGYFNTEIDRWMRPELPSSPAAALTPPAMVEAGLARLAQKMPNAKRWSVSLPQGRSSLGLQVSAELRPGPDGKEGEPFDEALDPATGQPLAAVRKTGGGTALYSMHWALHYMPYRAAMYVVGVATMFMLVALVSGVVVHKKIFADFFTFRPGKGQRSWLDAHNVASVMALPFFVLITYSGLVFYTYEYMPSVRAAMYGVGEAARQRVEADQGNGDDIYDTQPAGQPAKMTAIAPLLAQAAARWGGASALRYVTVINPGDAQARIIVDGMPQGDVNPVYPRLQFDGVSGALLRELPQHTSGADQVSNTLIGLHEGHFAGTLLRWLYFVSGLLGAAMVATGLLLWTSKRRQRLGRQGVADAGLRFVEHFNVGIVAGLPIAIASYFWANRLLPVPMPARDEWEMHALFAAWALMLLHAALRPTHKAWPEQLGLATLLFALLPLLNALTTDIHLGRTLSAGDWVLAGFDLTMWGLAVVFGWAWFKARGRTVRVKPAADVPAVVSAVPQGNR